MIEAQHRSRCPACDEWIEEGDEILLEDGEWIHQECSDA